MNALADYYAKRAPEYERIYQKPERQADLHVLRESVAATFSRRRVLEVACGTGWWTQIIARTARSVTATDVNEEVLAIARTKPQPRSNVVFQICDAFDLPAVGDGFEAAFAAFWWSHLTRAELSRFLEALHQKLQPGSIVVFIDNNYAEGSSTPISRRDEEGNTWQLRKLDDGTTIEVLKNFPTDQDLRTALDGRSGTLSIERLTYYWLARCSSP
jgi:demethylmenaquinone methyltransferase/2-methoxy-6-polyprenyl-1,4-benzoquinol methylase